MPRNYASQYRSRTHACYSAATDAPVTLPTILALKIHPLAIIPTRALMLSRVTRVGWSLKGSTAVYAVRLVELASVTLGVFTPAARRTAAVASLSTAHRGPLVAAVPAAGPQIFASWTTGGISSKNARSVDQAAVLENPIELAAGRGLALEVELILAGSDSALEAYIEWEEFQ